MDEWERYRYEQARAWLEHIRRLGVDVANTQAMIDDERARLDGIRGIDYTRERVSGTPTTPDIANLVDKLFGHIREYTADLSAYEDERRKAFNIIRGVLEPKERYVLTQYYLLGETWNDVRTDLGYSWQGIMKLRKRAVVSVYDVMPTDWRDPMPPAL